MKNSLGETFPFSLAEIRGKVGPALVPASFVAQDDAALWLEVKGQERRLAVLAPRGHALLTSFEGQSEEFTADYSLLVCKADQESGRALRAALSWLRPAVFGLATSAGFGDRLGLATPGHVRALQQVLSETPGSAIAPIFAQQSMREMQRTSRTPEVVLDDATWGTFQAGWRGPVGADADHLKTLADIDACAAAGYSFYTIDPGAYVDSEADEASPALLREKLMALPWDELADTPADLRRRYVGSTLKLESQQIVLDEPALVRAAVKYGRAVAHVARMYRRLANKGIPFDFEVSVDETETPTTPQEHIYVASELKRLDVQWVSMAPRYIGRFEKGIDYLGDLAALRQDFQAHAEIARALGPYKLSLHSGSDKFSVYPLISEAARGMVHLKTAGTSYVEALRVVAQEAPALFRELLAFACERYPQDRASYHVSAEVGRVPDVSALPDAGLTELLDEVNTRQVLHVTFGSALATFGADVKAVLQTHADLYSQTLEQHFYLHLKPFAALSKA
ncbi:MAG TPA: tagaturonate epimerase family protein [Ktedonobacterales bacterium]